MDTIVLPPDDDKKWAQVVGSLILHFGSLEFLSFVFIEILDNAAARDAAMRMIFSKRIKLVRELIGKSQWKDNKKQEALKLWGDVAKECKLRNEVAHNPFYVKLIQGKNVGGIINVRHLRGSGPYSPPVIRIDEIILAHNRVGKLVLSLKALIKS